MKKSFICLFAVSLALCMTISVAQVNAAEQRLVVKDTAGNTTFNVFSDGFVGIGTTDPQMEIDLGGGGITVNGQDVVNLGSGISPGALFSQPNNDGRMNFGYGGRGGGNLEAYSAWHVNNNNGSHRYGEFRFVYGGAPGVGFVQFGHYDGTTWTTTMRLDAAGDLEVLGDVSANTVISDYVFEDDYKLMPIKDVEAYIEKEGHLPNVISAVEFKKNPIGLGKMQTKLLEKIEELTLYTIEQEKNIEQLTKRLVILEKTQQ